MTIRKSIRVERPPEVVFRVFTEEIGKWWPLKEGFSFGGEKAKDIFIEGRVGGRFFERFTDGTEFEVGRITAFQPPHVVKFTWKDPGWEAPTEVEVKFAADGSGTRSRTRASRMGSGAGHAEAGPGLQRWLGHDPAAIYDARGCGLSYLSLRPMREVVL